MKSRFKLRPPRGRGGFSLIELLVATVVLMTIMSALGVAMVTRQQEYVTHRYERRADEATRSALAVIETAVRSAGANPLNTAVFSAPGPLDPNPLGNAQWDNVRVRADFNPADGDLLDTYEDIRLWVSSDTLYARWSAGGAAEPVALPVRSLTFAYFRHDGTQVTTVGTIWEASRVRVTVTAPVGLTGSRSLRRSGWIYLRNRS